MPEEWIPSEEQKEVLISHFYKSIANEIEHLQNELKCPDEFIYDFLEAIRDHYSPESGFTRIRKSK